MKPAVLVLEDGEVFRGQAFGAPLDSRGEVVFNTGMTGYQEVLTDPSYNGQIVVMTYTHIGNYGINQQDIESAVPRVSGFVVRDVPEVWSNHRGTTDIDSYLRESGIAGITEVDTRRLTRHIRSKGAMNGVIAHGDRDVDELIASARSTTSMQGADLVVNVTAGEAYEWPLENTPTFRVAAYDFGIKFNILRQLAEHGCATTVFPADTPAERIIGEGFDGVFLSNGPGDPAAVGYAIETIEQIIGRVPIFGICLGHQLLSLAAGLSTYKLAFGHRGVNHPVMKLDDATIEITTQNHGFAVSLDAFGVTAPDRPGAPMPKDALAPTKFGRVQLSHLNLNDYTVEGVRFLDQPAFSVQYHPEAGPGPHDARYLFDLFTQLMQGGT
ncbi:MAG: glutamine-hydrolyzing carbamoyl-phosphate synthase small subunit [Actinobacteria bacterium]|nr:glutamine-hydrolyzing carbamoyl-phosphate synthase small subunit [Actinomycetota bacterium]